ncbi:TolC family protein [Flavobacterium kingsejongi]|uniref:Transporter n=1 Tax=Flavobacterium kingsejongi TaxID=1678728 RepID=A0A2S1LPQ4_9FLAO|nr:TolC family protein [Flavobacterium kingsejongi]AWG25642.1 hypothetical protein FK004_10665 [Flavobacterium kingsejongi]
MKHFLFNYLSLLSACFCLLGNTVIAQEKSPTTYVLSIEEALQLAKANNDHINSAKLNTEVSESELKEVKSHALPHVMAQATGKRLTNATLYEHGLSGSESLPPPPSSYQATMGLEASFNLYSGGKHEAAIEESEIRSRLAAINLQQQTGSISLQVLQHYLEMIRLSRLDSLYKDQINRENLRLKNINALYKNGKVTRSDVLRAEINLSNQQFAKTENESTILIFNNRLNVLLHLPEKSHIILSDTAVVNTIPDASNIINASASDSYTLQAAHENTELQQSRIKSAKSNYYPSIELISAYGYNYPNYLIYPYVDQVYAIGFVGVKVQYSLSSLYQNNHKVNAEKKRLEETRINENAAHDNAKLELSSLQIKVEDMREKIGIAQKNIEQSQVNYKIVSTKYFNQLALLTDLLEADNLYLQSKYRLIEAQISMLNYYYQILYTTGKL